MKLLLAQLNPTIGDLEGNFEKILGAYRHAVCSGADLMVGSEMALLGYPPKDLLDRREIIHGLERSLSRLAAEVGETGLILGTVAPSRAKAGKPLLNAAVFLCRGKVVAIQPKTLLPSYDVFDEERYFEPAEGPWVIEHQGKRLGLTICEDIWNLEHPEVDYAYHRRPVDELAALKPDLLINISASPFFSGKHAQRLALLRNVSRKTSWPIVYVNQVGANDELIFDGRSLALNERGEILAGAKAFEEDLVSVEVPGTPAGQEPKMDRIADVVDALCLGIRDYLRKCGFKKVLFGLSGGIDSSVVACLARRALGAENCWGIAMPSQFNLSDSLEDARALADNLGIRFDALPIQPIFEQYLEALEPIFEDRPFSVAEENTQARIRGDLLMATSNKFGHLLLTTGNKSELAVGYCTLYGDMCGGLAVISDVPKLMVYEIAEWFNRENEIIPRRVIDRPPSAELRPDQKDQDSLPAYDILDQILTGFVEERCTAEELVARGFDPNTVDQVLRLININEYKRSQAAPGLKVTSKAFGFGRRWPIAKSFSELMRRQ